MLRADVRDRVYLRFVRRQCVCECLDALRTFFSRCRLSLHHFLYTERAVFLCLALAVDYPRYVFSVRHFAVRSRV